MIVDHSYFMDNNIHLFTRAYLYACENVKCSTDVKSQNVQTRAWQLRLRCHFFRQFIAIKYPQCKILVAVYREFETDLSRIEAVWFVSVLIDDEHTLVRFIDSN